MYSSYFTVIKKQQSCKIYVYPEGLKSSNRKYEISVDTMMDTEVANPLRMLSAYLITMAMTKPPKACKQRKVHRSTLRACEHSDMT